MSIRLLFIESLFLISTLLTACARPTTPPPSATVIPVEATATHNATPRPERFANLGTSPLPAPRPG